MGLHSPQNPGNQAKKRNLTKDMKKGVLGRFQMNKQDICRTDYLECFYFRAYMVFGTKDDFLISVK